MTLNEVVMQQKDDELLYIGAGSNYLFIGTKEEYFKDIEGISNHYYDTNRRFFEKRKADLYWCQNNPIKVLYRVGMKYMDSYQLDVEQRFKRMRNLLSGVIELKTYLDNFVPFEDREVVEISRKELFEPGTRLLITGRETGRWWFRKEYQTKTVQISEEIV